MDKKDVLERAITKAIAGGYKPDGITEMKSYKPTIRNGQAWVRWFNDSGQEVIQDLEHVIFNHDFAKAIWGDFTATHNGTDISSATDWSKHIDDRVVIKQMGYKYHLQQMVIADDPIKYLGKHLEA